MQGYRDPDLKPDLDALVRSDHSSAYCLGQTLLAVLFVLFVFCRHLYDRLLFLSSAPAL